MDNAVYEDFPLVADEKLKPQLEAIKNRFPAFAELSIDELAHGLLLFLQLASGAPKATR